VTPWYLLDYHTTRVLIAECSYLRSERHQNVRSNKNVLASRMWWTITGNFGNILPIDWSKSYARKLHMPALNLNENKVFILWHAVGIVTGDELDDRGVGVRVPVGSRIFSKSSRLALRSTQPPVQWVPGALSPGVKRPGREADHSPPTSAEVKKTWIYTSTPPYAFTATTLPFTLPM
jgi:hypothetical protein